MMKVILILLGVLFINCCENQLHGQSAYVNTQQGIYRLTGGPGNCTRTPVTDICNSANLLLSIAVYKDTLYCNTWSGELKRFIIGVPGSCRVLLPNISAENAMTVDKDGIIYMGTRKLYRYNPHTNVLTDLGNMPFTSGGDLIFFKDKLLLAGSDPVDMSTGIYEININNLAASTLYMSTPGFIGLISYPVACGSSRYFGISTTGNNSQLTELDLVNKVVIGNSCSIPLELLDAASSTETGLDDNVTFTNVQITKACGATTATVQAAAVYAEPGVIMYTLDNSITNTTGLFQNVPAGQHSIVASAALGACTNDTSFTIAATGNLISNIAVTNPANCGINSGSIIITASSANPPLAYTLVNTGVNQSTGNFTNLAGGSYNFHVEDAGGCAEDTIVTLTDATTAFVSRIEVTSPSFCNTGNGEIKILLNAGNATAVSSINNASFSSALNYTGLTPGSYYIQVKNGTLCYFDTTIVLKSTTISFVKKVQGTASRCNADNGTIAIVLDATDATVVSSINNAAFLPMLGYPDLAPGSYYVQVKNGAGCYFDTTIIIAADNSQTGCNEVFIPNAFTPNNDSWNEVFSPSIPPVYKNIVLRIFNRWGEKVYEGKGNNVSWDGTYKGKKQPQGVYIYHLGLTNSSGVAGSLKGTLTLIR